MFTLRMHVEVGNEVRGIICLWAKYAIEMYWNVRNKLSERTTGQILAGEELYELER